MSRFAGKFYWPSAEFSVRADNLCGHNLPSPNADFTCVRTSGHPGKHHYEWSIDIRDYSHKGPKP